MGGLGVINPSVEADSVVILSPLISVLVHSTRDSEVSKSSVHSSFIFQGRASLCVVLKLLLFMFNSFSSHHSWLHKGDALCLRYGWTPSLLPFHCVCRASFTVEHALNCKCGGFPAIRHNELWNITPNTCLP